MVAVVLVTSREGETVFSGGGGSDGGGGRPCQTAGVSLFLMSWESSSIQVNCLRVVRCTGVHNLAATVEANLCLNNTTR